MRLEKRARTLAMAAAMAGGSVGLAAGVLLVGTGPASATTLPAYTSNGFCSTQTVDALNNIQKKVCTGNYVVNKSNYQFTQDAINACPKDGAVAELTEVFISQPTGGSPTVLDSYSVHLS